MLNKASRILYDVIQVIEGLVNLKMISNLNGVWSYA